MEEGAVVSIIALLYANSEPFLNNNRININICKFKSVKYLKGQLLTSRLFTNPLKDTG